MDKRIYSTARFILPSTTPYAKMSNYRISFNNPHDVCIVHLRGVAYDAQLLAQAVSSLSIHPTSPDDHDRADEIDDEVYQQERQLDVAIDKDVQSEIIEEDVQSVEDKGSDETLLFASDYAFTLLDGEAPDWFKALDVGSPKEKCTPRSPLEWLNLGVSEKQILLAIEKGECFNIYKVEICPEDESATGQDFESELTECGPEEPVHSDTAEEVADESAENKATETIAQTPNSIETLRPDVVSGGSATDLKDEEEKLTAIVPGCGLENTNIANPTTPALRSWIPEDLSDQVDEFYNNLPSEFHEDSQKTFARSFSVANVEWSFMSAASRYFRELGAYVPKRLEAANYKLSSDGFWKNCPPSDSNSSPSVPVVSDKIGPPFHHFNFLGHPVYQKSSTPAEVSLWLAMTSHKKHPFDTFSRQGVITSQATKLIDPFVYLGQDDVFEQSGTQLRNAVVGLVEKAYDNQGTWLYDGYDEDEEVPRNADWNEGNVWRNEHSTGKLQAPHWMSRYDCDDTIINDGKGSYVPKPTRRNPDSTFKYMPSRIRVCAELEAAEAAARRKLAARMLAVRPFLEVKLNFHVTSEEQVEEVSENREEQGIYIPCLPLFRMSQLLTSKPVAEIPCGDLDQIPFQRGLNEMRYGPIAIAVGHKAYQLADWISSRFW